MGLAYILKKILNPLITHTYAHAHTHACTCARTFDTHGATWRLPTILACGVKMIFNFEILNNSKINSEKFRKIIEKSLKIRKFITFKIQLQINQIFFWIRN